MTIEEAKAALRSTDNGLVSLQATVRNLARRVTDCEQAVAGLAPDDPQRSIIGAQRRLEQQRLEDKQASLEKLVQTRARLQELIERADG